MILEEIAIRDFRSHRNTKVRLDQGISVIVGDNGSGKTSILEAVNFALFKQKPRGVGMDDLIRRGEDEAVVSVKFHSNSRVFRVVRGRKKGRATGSALYLLEDGEETTLAMGEDEITKEVETLLNISGELFTSAIYIKQGEIDGLISAEASARKEQVGRLLGTQELENAYRAMPEIIKEFERRIDRMQRVPDEVEKLEETIREERKKLQELKREKSERKKLLAGEMKKKEQIEKRIENLEAVKEIANTLEKKNIEFKNIEEKLEEIREYEKSLREAKAGHRKYVSLEKEIERLREKKEELGRYRERNDQLSRELDVQKEKLASLERDINSILERCKAVFGKKPRDYDELSELYSSKFRETEEEVEIEKELKKFLSDADRLKGSLLELENAATELRKATGKCPVCGAKLTERHKRKLLKEYAEKIREKNSQARAIEGKIKRLNKKSEKVRALREELEGIAIEVARAKFKDVEERRERAGEIETQLKKITGRIERLHNIEKLITAKEGEKLGLVQENERYIEATLFLRKNLPEKEELERRSSIIEKEIQNLKEELEKAEDIEDVSEALSASKNELKSLRVVINEYEKRIYGLESLMKEKSTYIDKTVEELTVKKHEIEELNKLIKFKIFLDKIRDLFHKDNLQKDLRIKSKPLIEKYTREIFDMFNLPYSDLSVTEDFNLLVYGPAGEENVDMLSGGERIAAALALRIGIAMALSGSAMELVMLDEPTVHLDTLRRRELVEIIKKLSSIPQTIVVTHDKEFESAADRLIVVEKRGGVSRVVA